MGHPKPKSIGDMSISVDMNGYPRWTRINVTNGERGSFIFDEEQAHDLHYALSRIVAFLDDAKKTDRNIGIPS
jgi:hypothetical protein